MAKIDEEFCLRIVDGKCITVGSVWPNLGSLISVLLKNALILSGFIFLFLLIFGGFSLIMGAGSGDAKKTAQGQQSLTTAAVGFALVIGAYWIIRIIEILTKIPILSSKL